MYIDKTYPFEPVRFTSVTCLDKQFGTYNLLNHYNNIYCVHINNLNNLLQNYPALQSYSLDELIFNGENINIIEKEELKKLSNAVYSHHVFFSSICENSFNPLNFPIGQDIVRAFGSIDNFYEEFEKVCLNINGSGYVFLTCDQNLNLSVVSTTNYDTPVNNNLYPLLGIDMWEHSYYLKFLTCKKDYICNFLSSLNWPHINNEYLECRKCQK